MITIRPVAPGEERVLWNVFRSSVHEIAKFHYSQEQLDAWAPAEYPREAWALRILQNRPFVAELEGVVAGFADIQPNGYIDQFFVSGNAIGEGVGNSLMQEIEKTANGASIPCIFSNVSRSAEAFFRKHGFLVSKRRQVIVRGVKLGHARMYRLLPASGGRVAMHVTTH